MVRRSRKGQTGQEEQVPEPNSEYFVRSSTLPGWSCKLCAVGSGKAPVMSAQQCHLHARTPKHVKAADAAGAPPPDELTVSNLSQVQELEAQDWVDVKPKFIGFWWKGVVEAQNGGKSEHLEAFIEDLVNEKFASKQDLGGWGYEPAQQPTTWDDWNMGSASSERKSRSHRSHGGQVWRHPQGSQDSPCSNEQRSAQSQVDELVDFASLSQIGPARRDRLKEFVRMGPDEQIAKIRENIIQLRAHD